MASKRNLYRPAEVQENVGQRKTRKTLCQGRLITDGGPAQGSVPSSGGQALPQGRLNVSHMSNKSHNTSHVSEHLGNASGDSVLQQSQLSNVSMNNSNLHHTSLVQGQLEESLFSPRRQVPTVSEAWSPKRGKPAGSLDLSDSEAGEESRETRTHYQKPDEVLCIDASRQTINPDVSEVDIRIEVNKSPVKITCHSPPRSNQSQKVPSSSKKENRPETAKKKKGRVIPSRYMQAAETKARASESLKFDKSVADKSVKASKSMEAPHSVKKSIRKVAPLNKQEKRREMARPSTPENQSMVSSVGGKTSTPTMDGSCTHDMDIDASAIHPEVSLQEGLSHHQHHQSLTTGKGRTRSKLKHDLQDELLGQSVMSDVSIYNQSTVSSKPKQKKDLPSLQKSIDLHYLYNLQWKFLAAKAKKTLEEQESKSMAQIYGIYEEVEKLRKVKMDKEQELARLKHVNTTNHMVEVQRQCLGPVVNNLSAVQKQYSNLAYALDTTRHQLPTADIYLPENEDQFQAELEAQLLESERLLGEITACTRENAPNINAMGDAMVSMEKAVEDMELELKKSQELLAATEALTIQECSLRAQEIQSLT